jgi:glycosyltransferase involved in cell wall biosynthesis
VIDTFLDKSDSNSPCRYIFTVFTPTYNRAHTLSRVYQSLQGQTFRDFEWLIIDDGSTDTTPELIKSWQKEADYPIRYTWQENQGINAAINRGVKEAQGKFFLIIGSDDSFVPETLDRFYFYWNAIPKDQQERFVGVTALCTDYNGHLIGSGLPKEIIDSDSMEIRYKHKIKGELWGFLRTDIFKQFPFPVLPGTKFVPEGILWSGIAKKYKTRFINVPLRVYWIDDSHNSDQLTKTPNPRIYAKGLALWHQVRLNTEIHWFYYAPKEFFRSAIHYGRFSFHDGVGSKEQFKNLNNLLAKILWLLTIPIAFFVFLRETK